MMRRLIVRYMLLVIADIAILLANYLVVAWVLSLFTKAQPDLDEETTPWGGWFGTWDNPPQGDEKWQREGWFPGETTGVKGYLNRVGWLFRNPGYGFQRRIGIEYSDRINLVVSGNPDISDKYKIPGSYLVTARWPKGRLVAFEYYLVKPYKIGKIEKCIRIRLGWKMMTDKFELYGFAAFVDTVSPFKKYGK